LKVVVVVVAVVFDILHFSDQPSNHIAGVGGEAAKQKCICKF
jgi:hypothetical protein